MKVLTNVKEFKAEILEVLHLFFPKSFLMENHLILKHNFEIKENSIINQVYLGYKKGKNNEICFAEATYTNQIKINNIENSKNSIKLAVYKLISSFLNKKLSWGILTNENLMQFTKKLVKTNDDLIFLEENLIDNFAVEPKKAEMISKILHAQKHLIENENLVNLYINIGGDVNNNFINFAINNFQKIDNNQIKDIQKVNTQINTQKIENIDNVQDIEGNKNDNVQESINFNAIFPNYFEALLKEIRATKKIIAEKSFVVKTIYIGGDIGLLNTNELDILLQELAYPVSEFTVECSSPQLLTKSKLHILKNNSVSKISIVAETFTLKTLKLLKKDYNFQDILNLYKNALELNLKIGIDLTAGLEQESLKSFTRNVNLLLELSPENIVINVAQNNLLKQNKEVFEAINYVNEKLVSDSYTPYFIFKPKLLKYEIEDDLSLKKFENINLENFENESLNFEKNNKEGDFKLNLKDNFELNQFKMNFIKIFENNIFDNIEIIGYTKTGEQSLFHSDCITKNSIIFACGANSTSSRVLDGQVKDQTNPKFIKDYVIKLDNLISEKIKLFS